MDDKSHDYSEEYVLREQRFLAEFRHILDSNGPRKKQKRYWTVSFISFRLVACLKNASPSSAFLYASIITSTFKILLFDEVMYVYYEYHFRFFYNLSSVSRHGDVSETSMWMIHSAKTDPITPLKKALIWKNIFTAAMYLEKRRVTCSESLLSIRVFSASLIVTR